MKVSEAVKVLAQALKDDAELKEVWRANIAMAVYDELEFNTTKPPVVPGYSLTECRMSQGTAVKAAGKGAERFLNQLIETCC